MRTRRQAGAPNRATTEAAWWWEGLLAQVEQIVRESGNGEPFDAALWLRAFLHAPSPALGNRPPSLMMETAGGRAAVTTVIAQMQSGAYG